MSFESVTFKIIDNSGKDTGKTYTCNAENKGFINSVLGAFVTANGQITQSQAEALKKAANGSGKDANVIEKCEVGDFFQKVAETDYYDYYDIIQKDGNTYIKIKKTGILHPDPKAEDIRDDFNLKSGVLLDNNRDLFEKRYNHDGTRESSYNHAKFEAGDELKIPGTPKLDRSASGWFLRLFSTH